MSLYLNSFQFDFDTFVFIFILTLIHPLNSELIVIAPSLCPVNYSMESSVCVIKAGFPYVKYNDKDMIFKFLTSVET